MGTSIIEILSKPLSQREGKYGTTDIQKLIIDGHEFSGYKTFSSHWEKTYVEQPERSASGVIENLDDYATFTTFIVKVNFAMMSIEDYRKLYSLMLQKNEFLVTAYNVLDGQAITQKMYFAPDQMPKLYAMARRLQQDDETTLKFVEVLGVQDYTIELIGTNVSPDTINILYYDKDGTTLLGSQQVAGNSDYRLAHGISVTGNPYGLEWKREGLNIQYGKGVVLDAVLLTAKEKSTSSIVWVAVY